MIGNQQPNFNLVDYLRTAIDQARINSVNGEFNLNLSFKDRFGNEDGALYVAHTLQSCQNITSLTLEFSSSRMKDLSVTQLMGGIQNLMNLKKLILRFPLNSLTSSSLTRIGEGIRNLSNLENLELNVEGLKVDDKQTINRLGEGLENCKKLSNLNLHFTYCNLEDSGLLNLCKSLVKCVSLKSLVLSLGNNGFSQYHPQLSQMIGEGQYQVYLKELETQLKKHNLVNFQARCW